VIGIASNLSSLRGQRALAAHTREVEQASARLGSGMRVNSARDDAAGMAIASQLNSNARIANRAVLNITDGISALETAFSATNELTAIVTRIAELAEQSANGTYSRQQREALNREAQALRNEYIRTQESTEFNGVKLLNGSSSQLNLQIGIRGDSNSALSVGIPGSAGSSAVTDRAAVLDGAGASFDVSHDDNHMWRGGAFTIEATVNISSADSDNGYIVSQPWHSSGEYNYSFGYHPSGHLFFMSWGDDGLGGSLTQYFSSTQTITKESWQHVAVSIGEDKSVRFFIEGAKVFEGALAANFNTRPVSLPENPSGLAIGTVHPTGGGGPYGSIHNVQGSVDQVRITHEQRYTDSFNPSSIMTTVDDRTALLVDFNVSNLNDVTDRSRHGATITARHGPTLGNGVNALVSTIAGIDLSFRTDALDALDYAQTLINDLSQTRGQIGASVSRLMSAQRAASELEMKSREAMGRIVNVDIATESAAYIAAQIKQQTASALLAQANQQPALALTLLRG
jgi:flagellin